MSVPDKWMMAMVGSTGDNFAHGDNYDLDAFKELANAPTEWAEQVRYQFEEVLRTCPVSVKWYIEHANADLGDEETLYRYLQEMYDFLFRGGPYPETEG